MVLNLGYTLELDGSRITISKSQTLLILTGKPKHKNGYSWANHRMQRVSVRNCPDDAEVPQPWPVYLFIYSFLQLAFIEQLICARYFARHIGFNGKQDMVPDLKNNPLLLSYQCHDHTVTDCPISEGTLAIK